MSTTQQIWTTKDAAEDIGVTDARIRQLCIQHNIGTKAGRDRLLTTDDMRLLRATRRKKSGEKSKKSR